MKITLGTLEVLACDYVHSNSTRMQGEVRKVAMDYIYMEYKDAVQRLTLMRYFEDAIRRNRK
jgi:hypothetical protein